MARLIKHEAHGPEQIEVNGEEQWICRCGLSDTKPLCDGSHHDTEDEEDGQLYVYDKNGNRTPLDTFYPDD